MPLTSTPGMSTGSSHQGCKVLLLTSSELYSSGTLRTKMWVMWMYLTQNLKGLYHQDQQPSSAPCIDSRNQKVTGRWS